MSFGQEIELFDKSNSNLIDNDLQSVAVDKNGNGWIGTSKYGLQKFDGQTFTTFDKNNSEIKGDHIARIFVDSKDNVWVAFSNPSDGIARYDGFSWTVFTEKDLGTNEVSVISICEDHNGTLYVGGGNGILTYADNTWSKVQLPIDAVTVRAIDVDSKGSLAIGHNSGLLIRNENNWKIYTEENSELTVSTIRAVKFKSNGDLLIGYGGGFGDGGLSIIEAGKWKHWNKSNSKMSDHMVRDIEIIDQSIWLSTNNGAIKMTGNAITPIFFRDGMYKNVILDIAYGKKDIWIATNFGLIKYVP